MEPITKVRYKEKKWRSYAIALWISFLSCQLFLGSEAALARCDKTPRDQGGDRIPGDNGFSVIVSGMPRKYRPNQVYTMIIKGEREEHIAKFQGFLLVAEPALGNTAIQGPSSLGTFQLMPGDAMTKFSHKCSHAVEATSSISKEEIQVFWTSPPRGSGCIDFKLMVVERQDVWYMDDGALTYKMCEDDSPLAEPTVVEPCCACDEAKYEVIFEGIWSRHTHPKDFPRDEWRTQFSTLIGASHSGNYSLWEYGRPASPALQVLGEHGVTRRLESEMKRYSGHIRSVVKAHGLQQRSNVAGQTFAVFRVDPTHHLLSVVSKMIPSPDWIVGLSKENLCLANCSWVDNRVIDLYPWDIGTDSGLRYDGPPTPQRPKGVVQRITSSNPHSPESPFFDPTGAPMKPASRLHLIKQRDYIKNCPDGRPRPGTVPNEGLNPSWSNPMENPDLSLYGPSGGVGIGVGGGGGTSYFYGTGIGKQLNTDINYDDPFATDPYQEPSYSTSNGVGGGVGAVDEFSSPDYSNPNTAYTSSSGGGLGGYDPMGGAANVNAYDYDTSSNYASLGGGGLGVGGSVSGSTSAGSGGGSYFGGSATSNTNNNVDPCQVTAWGEWSECSATCDSGSQNRLRDYVDRESAQISSCNVELFEKRVCEYLPKCETRSYAGSFTPFELDQQMSGITTPWLERGLESENHLLQGPNSNSYTYDNPSPGYGSPNSGVHQQRRNSYSSSTSQRQGYRHSQPGYSNDYPSAPFGSNSYTYDGNGNMVAEESPRSARLNAPKTNSASAPSDLTAAPSSTSCEVTPWGDWSDCSSKCDTGSRTRSRMYSFPERSSSCTLDLYEVQPCRGNEPDCPPPREPNGTPSYGPAISTLGFAGGSSPRLQEGDPACQTSDWSDWSPCSKKCGSGFKRRTRLYMIPFVPNRSCDVRLYDKTNCYGDDCGQASYSYDYGDDYSSDDNYEKSTNVVIQSLVETNSVNGLKDIDESHSNPGDPDNICHVDPDPGTCHGYAERWYYDQTARTCKTFAYTGCYGNRNNFASKTKCEATCLKSGQGPAPIGQPEPQSPSSPWSRGNTAYAQPRERNWRNMEVLAHVKETTTTTTTSAPPPPPPPPPSRSRRPSTMYNPLDCKVSAWSPWSSCSRSCGIGWQTRQREVLVIPSPGGKSCPRKMNRRKKCRDMICPTDTKYWYQGSWRHMTSPEDT